MTAAFSRGRILSWRLLACGAVSAGVGCDSADETADEGVANGGDDEADAGSDADSDEGLDPATATGQVAFRFEISSTVIGSVNLTDELTGSIYGGVFLTADVSITGPREGATQLASVEAHDIDLTADRAVSELAWTSDGLEPGDYTFLGYFDVDGSSDDIEDKDPEMGDPVTLPTVNKFTVEAGQTGELTVRFDLVFS